MDIHQGGDCCGVVHIEARKARQMLERSKGSESICPSCITSFVGGGGGWNIRFGGARLYPSDTVRYGIFRV